MTLTVETKRTSIDTGFASLDFKSVAADGAFEGYASLFNSEDLGHDVVAPGAFRQSLAERGVTGIKLLFQHDPAQPIGTWTSIVEDRKGLYVKGQLLADVTKAREVLSLMRAGAIDGLSIGFRTVKGQRDARTGLRRLERVDLWEISVVTFPMQPEARIDVVKSRGLRQGPLPTERELEQWLTRDAGLTRKLARTIVASGLKAATRDAGGEQSDPCLIEKIERARKLFVNATPQRAKAQNP